jgi:hypothetical protein
VRPGRRWAAQLRAACARWARWSWRYRLLLAGAWWVVFALEHPTAGGYVLAVLLAALAPTFLQLTRRRPGPYRSALDLTVLTVAQLQQHWQQGGHERDGGGVR